MPYQIFRIARPPEEPPLTRRELWKLISLSRKDAEWEVREMMIYDRPTRNRNLED